MSHQPKLSAFFVLPLVGLLSCFWGVAHAARIAPSPVLTLLENGYGVVAAEVIDAKLVTTTKDYPAVYDIDFRIHQVAAQPVTDAPFRLLPGESLRIRATAGYACPIEDDPASVLAKGTRYYLILHRTADGVFRHAGGASALRPVSQFSASDDQFYASLRGLASEPAAHRSMACADVVKNPNESDRLRIAVLSALFYKLWPYDTSGDPQVRATLLKLWNDPNSHLSVSLLQSLDWVLKASDRTRTFENSPQRCDVWLKTLLASTPAPGKDDNNLDNTAGGVFSDLATKYPDVVARQLIPQLSNKHWPPLFRRSIACGLLTAYTTAEEADPSWESSLTAYYIDLIKTGDPFPIRVAAGDLENFAGVNPSDRIKTQRTYLPDADLKAAIKDGVNRLTAASTQPGADTEYGVAALTLQQVARRLDVAPNPASN
jgi:hypothetical protein